MCASLLDVCFLFSSSVYIVSASCCLRLACLFGHLVSLWLLGFPLFGCLAVCDWFVFLDVCCGVVSMFVLRLWTLLSVILSLLARFAVLSLCLLDLFVLLC